MQDRPDKVALLGAIARFLDEQVRPVVGDKALQFRVLVAAHLVGVVAREVATEDRVDPAHLAALQTLLGGDGIPEGASARREAITAAEQVLAAQIRDGTLDLDVALPILRELLAAKLRVSNPRFDLSPAIEG